MKKFFRIISAFLVSGILFLSVNGQNTAQISAKSLFITPPAPEFTDAERQAELAARRAAVAAKLADQSVLMLFSAEPRIYTGDVDFMYRQENNLYYLTGIKQNGATLIITKNGDAVQEILLMPKPNPAQETWTGKMLTNDEARRISGVQTLYDTAETIALMQAVKDKKPFTAKDGRTLTINAANLYLLLPASPIDRDDQREFRREIEFSKDFAVTSIDEATNTYKYEPLLGYKVQNAQPIFAELRLIKSAYELKLLQHAIDITTEAHESAMSKVRNLHWEYEAQAEVEYVYRRRHADYWGYPSIVGCGPNATTLHYEESQSKITTNSLLLMDVGAEYDHYTADVTRTFPVNGKFSKEQAAIYQIVYDAQEAAALKIKPGAKVDDASNAAEAELEKGLAKLGLITEVGAFVPGTEKEITNAKGEKQIIGYPQFRIWYMHGWGHWLGMNVHDVGIYDKFAEGMVTTNEPGIYIREDALNYLPDKPETKVFIEKIRPAYEKYKNIGVRIEDDLLVTKTGAVWLTKNLPRKMSEIEKLMAQSSKK